MFNDKLLEKHSLSNGNTIFLLFDLSAQRMFKQGYTVMTAYPEILQAPLINKYKSKDIAYNAYADILRDDVLEIN